jgi:type IV conjugative transfer system coupling protein TraD
MSARDPLHDVELNSARAPRGAIRDFTRGSEIWWHQAVLFLVSFKNAVLLCLVIGFLFFLLLVVTKTTGKDFKRLIEYSKASLMVSMGAGDQMTSVTVDDRSLKMSSGAAVIVLNDRVEESTDVLWKAAFAAAIVSATLLLIGVPLVARYGKQKMTDEFRRGAKLVDAEVLEALMLQKADVSPYRLANVPIRKGAESLHFMITGAQGTGKSQAFFQLMDQVRTRGKRAIVYDPSGEFTKTYFREGRDVIMNPLDARSPNWNVWNEIIEEYHKDNVARGLIPEGGKNDDPFWSNGSRIVFKEVVGALAAKGTQSNRALYEALALNPLSELHTLLEGTPGAGYTDPATEKTGMSIKMTIQNQLEPFRFLRDDGEEFSIQEWIKNESDSWMFISTSESQADAMRPLLSLWVNTAIQAVLELEPIHRERLWFFLDEFPRLQRLDSIEKAVTNTRKYGLCMVLGIQDFGQLREKYGPHIAQTLISQCQTQLLLRIRDGRAAMTLAELMGKQEFDEKEESFSFGINAQRDGVNVLSRRTQRDLVLGSEILGLPDMQGFLTTPGAYPVARVSYEFVKREPVAPAFVKRVRDTGPEPVPAPAPALMVESSNIAAVTDRANEIVERETIYVDGSTQKKVSKSEAFSARRSPHEFEIQERGRWADALG